MVEIRKTDVFVDWLDGLKDIRARARVLVRIERLAAGNPGDVNLFPKASQSCGSVMALDTEFISKSVGRS